MLLDQSYLVRKLCYSSKGYLLNVLAEPQPLKVISTRIISPSNPVIATKDLQDVVRGAGMLYCFDGTCRWLLSLTFPSLMRDVFWVYQGPYCRRLSRAKVSSADIRNPLHPNDWKIAHP